MLNPKTILPTIPAGLRDPLLESYEEIARNYMEHRWEPAELNGGKFSETVYTLIEGSLQGAFAAKPSKPQNMLKACQDLELIAADPNRIGDRSLRILIPRVLPALYEIRNNRGVGHAGGEVNPNFLDATFAYGMASWVLAELVRIFHSVSTKEAQEVVDELVERKHPLIWEVDGVRRVLDPKMNKSDQALLLLYSKHGWITENDLYAWTEYSDLSLFRKRVLCSLHDSRLIEYDKVGNRARISPLGCQEAEQRLLTRI